MRLNIRRMERGDAAKVAQIAAAIMPFAWELKLFLSCFRENYSNLVLEREGEVVGFSVIKAIADENWLLNFGIEAKFQRQGLGRYLLEHVLLQSNNPWWLEVRASNSSAINLYKQLGFKEILRRTGYYPGDVAREDAIVMRRVVE